MTDEECIKIAKKLGKRIGTKLHIPIHLYEKAARSPERKNLAHIRKEGYKDLPDFGPKEAGTAGSTALGVGRLKIL